MPPLASKVKNTLDFFTLHNLRNHFLQLLLAPRAPAQEQLVVSPILMRPFMSTQLESHDRRRGPREVALRNLRITLLIGLLGIDVI